MDGESQNAQDARVERLWRTLDTRQEGQLDLNGLKKGLRRLDHRWLSYIQVLRNIQLTLDYHSSQKRRWSAPRRYEDSGYQR